MHLLERQKIWNRKRNPNKKAKITFQSTFFLVSLPLVLPLVTKGYGLREEDLNEIIIIERLNDISRKFSESIQRIQEKLNSKTKIRMVEFNELSGTGPESKHWFNILIQAQRHIFYSYLHSNKDCCVLFYYAGYKPKKGYKLFNERILPHEFAHHYQWASLEFPILLPKGTPEEYLPQFIRYFEIGPKEGSVYMDGKLFDNNLITLAKDFSERISDFVCERILIERGFKEGALEQYREDRNSDPAEDYPPQVRSKLATEIRYMRRLTLLDAAEWHAILNLIYPNDQTLQNMLSYDKKWVIHLNKKFDRAKKVFNKIYEISLTTNYNSFKNVKNAVSYFKRITNMLGIEIKTQEAW